MTVERSRKSIGENVAESTVKETNYSYEIDRKMRFFVNMIIDRVLEDRKKGILHTANESTIVKGEYEN